MIVPFTKPTSQGPTSGPAPSESDMLMALATMHSHGRFDQATAGPESSEQKYEGAAKAIKRKLGPKEGPPDRPLNPGESLPDQGQGGTQMRDVRGI